MKLRFDPKDVEELTSNVKQIQDNVLEEILKENANTEYLQRFLQGATDKELFKKNVPVVTYEDVEPYIDRVANGEPSDLISGEPITAFIRSTGTSGGKVKIFPANNKYIEDMAFVFALRSFIISKHVHDAEQGKRMAFHNTLRIYNTPSGLPAASSLTFFLTSDIFKNRPSNFNTSPDEVTLCPIDRQNVYCHLLCGLVCRDEVVCMISSFACFLVRAIIFLENNWRELCSNIRSGYVSEWITDLSCRDAVSIILGGPNPKLADLIEQGCSHKSWEGIVTRIWPKTKFIQTIVTGSMAQYIPILDFYSNKLPLISPSYGSSETMFGVNMNPLCRPQDVSYTFMPNLSYFEFLPVDEGDNNEIVDLVNVKLGCFYEPLITNYSGLHRYKMGDILQVTGFYNSAPQFKFVRRKNMVISIQLEATSEDDISKALTQATRVLESSDSMLMGFTFWPDISTDPGHYVMYWEMKSKNNNGLFELDSKVLVECCCVVEESLNRLYRMNRRKLRLIGALEIRVVQQGTFDSLMDFFISLGASIAQYKTPSCINSSEALAVLENRVLARFFSDKCPPFDS
ncbi:hypothetical protein N665_0374s0014 [Sinapis alba]|nr:hypothetical protein N665_0374s0014 [Sinapis alba]